MMLVPAIFYIIAIVGNKCWARLKSNRGQRDGLSDFPALVTGQASTETHTTVTQTSDPTSVEFESVFHDLIGEALKRNDRKLLLVIDNLDRVQSSDALSIWSTMQTLLGHSDNNKPKWFDRVWVLIPYDSDAILRLWDNSDGFESKSPNKTLTETFLDKTFQIRFRVPATFAFKMAQFPSNSPRGSTKIRVTRTPAKKHLRSHSKVLMKFTEPLASTVA